MPLSWMPLLNGAVAGARILDEQGAILCFQLLSAFIEAGGPSIAHYVPSITSGVQQEITKYLVPYDGRWPQVATFLHKLHWTLKEKEYLKLPI